MKRLNGSREFGRLRLSSLDMRPYTGEPPRPAPFTFVLYVDVREGSYINFGRRLHITIGWAAKKPRPKCAWANCKNDADPARPGSGPFDDALCSYHDEIQKGDPPFVPEHPLTNPTEENT